MDPSTSQDILETNANTNDNLIEDGTIATIVDTNENLIENTTVNVEESDIISIQPCQNNYFILSDEPDENNGEQNGNSIFIDVYPLLEKQNELRALLTSWGLMNLYEYLKDQHIYLDDLKLLTSELAQQLLKDGNFKWNVIINFNHNLRKWQEHYNTTETASTISSQITITPPTSFTSTSTEPIQSSINLSILNILNISAEGRMILNVYQTNNKLNETQRNLLVSIIVEHFIRLNLSMATTTCEHIADQIVAIMPNEEKEYYYVKRKNASPLGSLYFKYHNRKSRTRKASCTASTETNNYVSKQSFVLSANEDEHIQALKHELLNHDEFMLHWNGSVKARINCIKESTLTIKIFEKWPQYKTPMGYRLINADYSALYDDNQQIMNEDFLNAFLAKITDIFDAQLKDQHCRAILNTMVSSEGIPNDRKYATAFYLLHGLLKANPSKFKKYSIRHCQNQFMFLASTVAEFEQYIIGITSPIQPSIVIVGPDILHPQEIIVYFDGMKYKLLSIVKAVDIAYKIFHLFNLKYPDAGFAVWQFIQVYFYNVKISGEVVLPKVVLLKKELIS